MKQTSAVEFVEKQLDLGLSENGLKSVITKAKEMEKQKDVKYDEMLEMLKYFTGYPDSDFEEFSYTDKFEMTVMVHKIAEAKQLIKEATEL
jgi:hypothetical protein